MNVGKTKVMKCGVGLQKVVDSGKYPCGVCGKGVEKKQLYTVYLMHEVGTQVPRAEDTGAVKCKTCNKRAQSLNKSEVRCVELDDGSKFELVDKFCYLSDMFCAGGGSEEASKTRVWSALEKFNELAPVFDKKGYVNV